MTFSPFYMGNHVKPWDEQMDSMGYTMTENWGFQVNFMVPLDKRGLEQCRRIAARQEENMRLNYEMARLKACAELQQKGFMIKPGTDFAPLCADLYPIAVYLKQQAAKNPQPAPEKKSWNPFKK
jgi:hypothetical protein